jgi:hypothetical protein
VVVSSRPPADNEETFMAEKITAELRTEFGKGAARRIRRDH